MIGFTTVAPTPGLKFGDSGVALPISPELEDGLDDTPGDEVPVGEGLGEDEVGEGLGEDDVGEGLGEDDVGEGLGEDEVGERLGEDEVGERLGEDADRAHPLPLHP
jgi:hypothetical protein